MMYHRTPNVWAAIAIASAQTEKIIAENGPFTDGVTIGVGVYNILDEYYVPMPREALGAQRVTKTELWADVPLTQELIEAFA